MPMITRTRGYFTISYPTNLWRLHLSRRSGIVSVSPPLSLSIRLLANYLAQNLRANESPRIYSQLSPNTLVTLPLLLLHHPPLYPRIRTATAALRVPFRAGHEARRANTKRTQSEHKHNTQHTNTNCHINARRNAYFVRIAHRLQSSAPDIYVCIDRNAAHLLNLLYLY